MGNFLPSPDMRLGRLEIETIYDFYDAPVLFLARDDLGHGYLAMAATTSEAGTSYLYVPISEPRLRAVRHGRLTLRQIFSQPERNTLFIVTVPSTADSVPPTVEEISANQILDSWLPPDDERLSEPGGDLEPFSKQDLLEDAQREGRHFIALELITPAEATLRYTGSIMVEFQELADQLSSASDFALTSVKAASVVLVMAPAVGDSMFGQASPELLTRLGQLVEAAVEGDFGSYLGDLPRRTRAHIRDFFSVLSEAGTGIDIIIASPAGGITQQELSLDKLRTGLRILRDTNTLPSERRIFMGYLEGINHARRTFSVRESGDKNKKGRRLGGKFDPEVDIEGVSSGLTILYRFTLIQEAEVNEFDADNVSYRNLITAMERITEPVSN